MLSVFAKKQFQNIHNVFYFFLLTDKVVNDIESQGGKEGHHEDIGEECDILERVGGGLREQKTVHISEIHF